MCSVLFMHILCCSKISRAADSPLPHVLQQIFVHVW